MTSLLFTKLERAKFGTTEHRQKEGLNLGPTKSPIPRLLGQTASNVPTEAVLPVNQHIGNMFCIQEHAKAKQTLINLSFSY